MSESERNGSHVNAAATPDLTDVREFAELVEREGEGTVIAALCRDALHFVGPELHALVMAEKHTVEDLARMRELVAMLVELSQTRYPLFAAPTGSRR
jgi:hypothetical protein